MPHDKFGQLLSVGDEVIVHCTVRSITLTDEYCNVTLDTVEPMFPGEYKTCITVNGKQVEKTPA